MQNGLTVKLDNLNKVLAGARALADTRVMVGIPMEKDDRRKETDSEPGNAALGYIHENGAPEVNIPARPWLVPPVEEADSTIVQPGLQRAGELAMEGKPDGVARVYAAMGIRLVNNIRAYIRAGIAPPLSERTIAARRRRVAGSKYRRKATAASDTTPLIDTGQLRNAVTYVIRTLRGDK